MSALHSVATYIQSGSSELDITSYADLTRAYQTAMERLYHDIDAQLKPHEDRDKCVYRKTAKRTPNRSIHTIYNVILELEKLKQGRLPNKHVFPRKAYKKVSQTVPMFLSTELSQQLLMSTQPPRPETSNTASTPDENTASAPDENAASTPDENTASAPDENAASTPDENTASAPDENAASTPDENTASAPDENTASAPHADTASAPHANAATHRRNNRRNKRRRPKPMNSNKRSTNKRNRRQPKKSNANKSTQDEILASFAEGTSLLSESDSDSD